MGWKRVGECPPERCRGRCCEHIGAWYDDTPENRAFLDTLRVRGVKLQRHGDKYLVDLPQRCQYLTAAGLCNLHPDMRDKVKAGGGTHITDFVQRPQFCWDWPQHPSQLLNDEDCGFSFIEEEEPAEVRR